MVEHDVDTVLVEKSDPGWAPTILARVSFALILLPKNRAKSSPATRPAIIMSASAKRELCIAWAIDMELSLAIAILRTWTSACHFQLSCSVFQPWLSSKAEAEPYQCAGKYAEDAGYLMLYVHNTAKCETWMVVYNAQTFDQQPVARAKIPVRIPYGFHGIHLTEQQLALQSCWSSSSR